MNQWGSRLFFGALLLLSVGVLTACSDNAASDSEHTVSLGVIAGPEAELFETAKAVAADRFQLQLKVVTFSDYILPNTALNDGSIDANAFQHLPYLEDQIKARGYDLVPVGKTFIFPMGLYSHKLKDLAAIKKGMVVAVPNDPSNETRALLLLQSAGLISVKTKAMSSGLTSRDITANPYELRIQEIDAAQLPRVLEDVDLAAINTTYGIPAGLMPTRDALFSESVDSPYANLIVVRRAEKDSVRIQQLVEAIQSPEVAAAAKRLFKGGAIPAWEGAED